MQLLQKLFSKGRTQHSRMLGPVYKCLILVTWCNKKT